MSAFFSAGESLTPSPVTATIAPWRWQPSTIISFCCGYYTSSSSNSSSCCCCCCGRQLSSIDDNELLLRWSTRKYDLGVVCEQLVNLCWCHIAQIWAMHDASLRIPAITSYRTQAPRTGAIISVW